jgi:hypothetical protein
MNLDQINFELSELADNLRQEIVDLMHEDMIRDIEEYWLSYVFDYESEWDF